MNRSFVVIVIAVAIGGVLAGGIMVWGYLTQTSDAAIATPVIGDTPQAPPPPLELISVETEKLALSGFELGLPEKRIRKVGRPLKLKFEKKEHDGGLTEYSAVPKRPKQFNSVRLLVVGGKVVALRVKYTSPQLETYSNWKRLLREPYFIDGQERHWETKEVQAKALRNAAKFYVALKEYRGRFPW